MVARLEEFPRTVVEHAGTQEVMQYRGQIIPLLRLSEIIPATRDADIQASTGSIQVVIYSEGKRAVGLIVDRIVDIVEEHAAVEAHHDPPGRRGLFREPAPCDRPAGSASHCAGRNPRTVWMQSR